MIILNNSGDITPWYILKGQDLDKYLKIFNKRAIFIFDVNVPLE